MNKAIDNTYPIKVWLYTVFLSPVVYFIIQCIKTNTGLNNLLAGSSGILYRMGVGALLSLPALWAYWRIFKKLRNTNQTGWLKKTIMGVAGVALIFISFYLIDRHSYPLLPGRLAELPVVYSFTLVSATLLLKMMKVKHTAVVNKEVN